MGDQKQAMVEYETAAGWFESDNAEALANKLYLKVADIAARECSFCNMQLVVVLDLMTNFETK